jgi:hypothetical protein
MIAGFWLEWWEWWLGEDEDELEGGGEEDDDDDGLPGPRGGRPGGRSMTLVI